ncbi:energy transducer TonB [Pseudomonas aeruginosa]|uniref:energy transducer TonB n=2 Tax=Pseudomonas aeruginosa TaxID=287 RepID=UPI000BB692AC|nr:energy transducer TonB [Pseudomonas aeruginosa]AXN23545.1 energy transducer TonB [Pseudomonas aeruginosa]PBV36509.1 energy transducer TonB [Pseudomonas aeruginosa]PBX09995.1 energy transducer TonB [Pseudomonas aeruginosa]
MATPQPVDARTQPWRETPGGDLVALGRPVRQALHLVRHNPAQGRVLSRRETILLVLFALTLHGAVIHWLSQQRTPALPEVPPQVPPMTIEFTAPAPPVVEPPPPEPLPPVVEEPPPPVVDENAVKPPPPKPVPKPKPKPKPQPRPKPAPEYPALAMRRGWEGTVLLRVHVLASGSPSEIQVQKSSGREALDQAAVKAVKRWSFVPAKRGDKAEDGWVSVPIDFKLN